MQRHDVKLNASWRATRGPHRHPCQAQWSIRGLRHRTGQQHSPRSHGLLRASWNSTAGARFPGTAVEHGETISERTPACAGLRYPRRPGKFVWVLAPSTLRRTSGRLLRSSGRHKMNTAFKAHQGSHGIQRAYLSELFARFWKYRRDTFKAADYFDRSLSDAQDRPPVFKPEYGNTTREWRSEWRTRVAIRTWSERMIVESQRCSAICSLRFCVQMCPRATTLRHR